MADTRDELALAHALGSIPGPMADHVIDSARKRGVTVGEELACEWLTSNGCIGDAARAYIRDVRTAPRSTSTA